MSTHGSSEPDEHRALVDEVMLGLAELQAATDALDEAVAERLGINRTDLQCVNSLYRRGGMTAGQLADESGLTPGAITTALDRLERAGYAQRTRDDVDRRRVLVELTPQSRQSAAELYAAVIEAEQAEYERYTLEELRLLRDFLQRAQQIQAEHVAHLRTSARGRRHHSRRRRRAQLRRPRASRPAGWSFAAAPPE